jgi:DinB superfamily
MTRTQQIADAYRAATVKDAWYGPSLAELLAQTSPQLATTPLIPGAHSISQLLQHLLLWNERVRNTSDSNPLPLWQAEKEWAEPPIPWTELVVRWNHSRDLLEEHLRNFPIEDLAKQVPGRGYPYETMLDGIVQHTIWHSGQIAMISSILRSRNLL